MDYWPEPTKFIYFDCADCIVQEEQFSDRVLKADQWSRAAAVVVAIVAYWGSSQLTGEVQFSSITAATAGIGARFLIPYWVSMSVPADERVSLESHPSTGNFHHGAVGGGLLAGAFVSIGSMSLSAGFLPAIGVGAGVSVGVFLVLSRILPR